MTIQIAQRIGRALNVSSATRVKQLDEALREYIRSVGPGATVPLAGSIDWSHVTSIPATFPPSAHTHPNGDLTGYTAADVLAKLLTVDGSGSGLDADLLDGQSSAAFAPAITSGSWTPADASGAGLAFTGVAANYFKIDKMVFARCGFNYPVTASGANTVVSGLPFNTANNEPARAGCTIGYSNAGILFYALADANAATYRFYDGATGNNLINSALSNKTVYMQLCYVTP